MDKQTLKQVIDLLMLQHESSKEYHNYWHVAANLIKAEFNVEDYEFTDEIKQLAKEAGFIFWDDSDTIDWWCDYTEHLVRFYHLVKNTNK